MQSPKKSIDQQKSQSELLQDYWHKWKLFIHHVKRQKYQAVQLFQFQTIRDEKLIRKSFQAWIQVYENLKFQKLLRFKNSLAHENQEKRETKNEQIDFENNKNANYQMTLAIKFHQRKTYAKCITSWICYGISCNKFQQSLSKTYIKYLLKKYFDVIYESKCKAIEKKIKKATNIMNSPKKQEDTNKNAQTQMNFANPTNIINQIDRFPATTQNFRELLHNQNTGAKKYEVPQPDTKTLYTGFQRNVVMGESRRSQFSTLSAQIEYNSKRKFKPITELPSIPDLENISKRQGSNQKSQKKQFSRSPIKSFLPERQLGESLQKGYSVKNLTESNVTQNGYENSETKVKQKILELLVKEKLLSLAILKGDQFLEGLEYENYRQKTVNSLRKLKDVKIR